MPWRSTSVRFLPTLMCELSEYNISRPLRTPSPQSRSIFSLSLSSSRIRIIFVFFFGFLSFPNDKLWQNIYLVVYEKRGKKMFSIFKWKIMVAMGIRCLVCAPRRLLNPNIETAKRKRLPVASPPRRIDGIRCIHGRTETCYHNENERARTWDVNHNPNGAAKRTRTFFFREFSFCILLRRNNSESECSHAHITPVLPCVCRSVCRYSTVLWTQLFGLAST